MAGKTIEELLRDALGEEPSADQQGGLAALAALIEARLAGREASSPPADRAALADLLRQLAGREIAAGDSLIAIGDGSQLGDVSIRDMAGGDMIRISIIGSQHLGAPPPSPDEARRLEEFRLEAQERIRRQAARYDADMALLRKLSVAVYQLRAALSDLRALGEYVTAEDLAGYQRTFDETRGLFFESRAFLKLDVGQITHDTLALHTSLVAGIRILLRQSELGLAPTDQQAILQLIERSGAQNDQLFRQLIAAIQEQTRDSSP